MFFLRRNTSAEYIEIYTDTEICLLILKLRVYIFYFKKKMRWKKISKVDYFICILYVYHRSYHVMHGMKTSPLIAFS